MFPEVLTQCCRSMPSDRFGDLIDTLCRALKAPLCSQHAQVGEPLMWSGPSLPAKLPGECSRRHSGPLRQQLHRQLAFEIGLEPMEQWRKVPARRIGHGSLDELGLAALAVRRYYETPRDLIRDFRSKVAANNMQAQVYPRGAPGRCQYRPFIDIQHIRFNMYFGIAGAQRVNITPMRCRALAIQQTCRSQDKYA